jgi:DNA helicase-2/ATP-dependent DNA helicase PcrA
MSDKKEIVLTPTQQSIVNSSSKRLLVLSCAGSGKTRVIVSRIERLIESGVDPHRILALTFSTRAAQEMKNRLVSSKKDKKFFHVQIKTFHAFGYELVRDFAKEMGFEKRVTISDPTETDSILKQTLQSKKMASQDTSALRTYIRNRKGFMSEDSDETMGSLFDSYEKALRLKSLVDLDDLIYLPVKLLSKNKDCQALIQNQYTYIFVDEYQDTSEGQNRFLDLLVGPNTSLCLVGDDDQAIYEWRGAKPGYIREKAKSGEYDCFYLTQNFRSEKNICDVANKIISHNATRVKKSIEPTRKPLLIPTYHRSDSQESEAKYVANEISRLLVSGKFNPSDIAVLYRNNNQQGPIKAALKELGIHGESLDVDENFQYSRFIKVLKSIVDFNSSRDLSEALNFPNRFFDQMAFMDAKEAYETQTGKEPSDDAMVALNDLFNSDVTFVDDDLFRHRYGYIHQLHYATDWSSTEVVSYLISDFETQGYINDYPDDYRYLQQVFEMAKLYEESFGKTKLSDFVDNLLIAIANNDESFNNSSDSVALLTMHRSKGLEFKAVFIIGLQVGVFPNDYWISTEEELEAERRLFYVAITRAKDLLYFTSYRDPLGAPADSCIRCGFLAEVPSVLYSREAATSSELTQLADKPKAPVKTDTPDTYIADIAERNKSPLGETGLFDHTNNFGLTDEQISKYQDECLVLSQAIEIKPNAVVVIIGDLAMKKDTMYGILKSNGIRREQVEYYDYKDSKLNYKRFANNENFIGVILGPNAHNQVGGYDLVSIFGQEGFPLLINLVKKNITKNTLQEAIIKIKLNYKKQQG